MNSCDAEQRHHAKAVYEAPRLTQLGSFHVETLHGCLLGKQWGGFDGIQFDGINIPVSNCS